MRTTYQRYGKHLSVEPNTQAGRILNYIQSRADADGIARFRTHDAVRGVYHLTDSTSTDFTKRQRDVAQTLQTLEAFGYIQRLKDGQNVTGAKLLKTITTKLPLDEDTTPDPPKVRSEEYIKAMVSTRLEHSTANAKKFRAMYSKMREENPNLPHAEVMKMADKEFHARYPNNTWVHIIARSSLKEFSPSTLTNWLAGRGAGETLPNLLPQKPKPEPKIEIGAPIPPTTEAARPLSLEQIRLAVRAEYRSTDFQKFIQEELRRAFVGPNKAQEAMVAQQRTIVDLLSQMKRVIESMPRQDNAKVIEAVSSMEDTFQEFIRATYNSSKGPMKTSLMRVFPWLSGTGTSH